MTDMNDKILGGGSLETITQNGKIYVDIQGLENIFDNVGVTMTSIAITESDPSRRIYVVGQATAMLELAQSIMALKNYATAPDLFKDN